MIELDQVTVEFANDEGQLVTAVNNVNLDIAKGEIFGVIGYSGAGKSTLVRTINMLQPPTSGRVKVNEKDMTQMSLGDLRQARKKIGMIFQHFNLMDSRTVAGNVSFPLQDSGLSKEEIAKKVNHLLDLVGLADKANNYPSQLSGGQKQRVAIARSLANDPDVLLCDEATSALDPMTTKSILGLLKDVNEELGITIVIITHEMSVVKEICDRVAVMENGSVVEVDSILNIFANPQAEITQQFIQSASPTEKGVRDVLANPSALQVHPGDRIIRIQFSGASTGEPLLATLTRQFDVAANILFANIEILQDTPVGTLLVALQGEAENIEAATHYLEEEDVRIHEYPTTVQDGQVVVLEQE